MDNAVKNRILVVDDEKMNLESLNRILSPEYTIFMSKSGNSAIEMACKYMPDLILLDIIMPDMDGYEVLDRLKISPVTQNIPVIFITGLDKTEDEEKGLDLNAADFIHKPFSAKIVKSRVRNQIQIINQIRALVNLQQDLEAAVKSAEEANQSKSAFLAMMSHEIRTPLNAILGISEIQLQNEKCPGEIKEALSRIYNSGDLLLGIINDILDMSKIEAGKLELTEVKYDVASLINDTAFFNLIKFENKPVEFNLYVDQNVPSELYGDELRIKQILNNLLSNAFKYTNCGEVELSISSETADTESGAAAVILVLRVRDTGQGMTEDQLAKLFDEYSRFNTGANRSIEGTGLGMNITQNFIRMMNGDIKAQSEPDKGTVFTVRLPQGNTGASVLGKESAEKLNQFRSSYEAKSKKNLNFKRTPVPDARVLVVDDMDMNLYVAKGMLSPYGIKTDTAANGMEAIEKIKRVKYDLVFMDHMMPVMDGVQATREIRKWEEETLKRKNGPAGAKNLPVIALTANAVSGIKEVYMSSGFNGFLSKPIGIKELDEVLKEWLVPGNGVNDEALKTRKLFQNDNETAVPQPSMPEHSASYEDKTSAGKTQSGFLNNVSAINDMDTAAGMKNMSGREEIYRKTLNILYGKIIPECNKMAMYLNAGDYRRFAVSVHGIKLLLGAAGASRLSETALELEIAAKGFDPDYCAKRFPLFREKLFNLRQNLSAVLL